MQEFEVLFDESEPAAVEDAAYEPYGRLGFPAAPAGRPWIYSNFVQSLDGIVSFKGKHAAGSDIARSQPDRWLMDLLRVHADAVLVGANTLLDETELGERPRGPVFRIMDAELRRLRQKLGQRREMNIIPYNFPLLACTKAASGSSTSGNTWPACSGNECSTFRPAELE